ncbi:MAG: hypothetical protein ACKVX9_19835 [Blastocatellia bacterium]
MNTMNHIEEQWRMALERRGRQARPLDLFFRDDDVDEDEPSLRECLRRFVRGETPVNLGVIPKRLTREAAALLRRSVREAPSLIELNQHGWEHINHEEVGKKCEFGPGRAFDLQHADIAAGWARMDAAFGSRWSPVFIPPWNRCTFETGRALDQLGFLALSRDHGQPPMPGLRLRELPITLDLYRWRGGVAPRPIEEFSGELIQQIDELDRIGIMLHHKVMDEAAFALVDALLRAFRSSPIARAHTFQSLLTLTA